MGISRHSCFATFLAIAGCAGPAPSGPPPEIRLTAPKSAATVAAAPEVVEGELKVEIEIAFAVRDVTLAKPGGCAGAPDCGHVHVRVDGDGCNDTTAQGDPLPYNEEVFASPADADLAYCKGVHIDKTGLHGADGAHVISVALFGDDERPLGASRDEVAVTAAISQSQRESP